MMMNPLVLQSDFGLEDGAVSAMKGVAHSVSKIVNIFDNTHDIPPFDIWSGSYRLLQTVSYWPENTVFVSVVDPGVGSERKSVVVKTKNNHDEEVNRLPKSGASHTFHGRDIYAYTGARIAAGVISFDNVGPELEIEDIVRLPFYEPKLEEQMISGTIDILDVRFGNLWTNISRELFLQLNIDYGEAVEIEILHDTRRVYRNKMTFGRSFAAIQIGEPVLYVNSLDNMAVAINQGSFAKAHNIGTGSSWHVYIKKV